MDINQNSVDASVNPNIQPSNNTENSNIIAANSESTGMFDFMKKWDWVEIIFMIGGAVAIGSVIILNRHKLKEEKTSLYDIQRRLDKQDQRLLGHDSDISTLTSVINGG